MQSSRPPPPEPNGAAASAKQSTATNPGAKIQSEEALVATAPGASLSSEIASRVSAAKFPVLNWDKYEFLSLLGSGGMGAVYKARDLRLGRVVALKFIRGDNPILAHRFQQEAHAQARLDHPNLCRIYDVGQVDGKPYIAMQFVEGTSLDRICGELSLHQKVELIRDAAMALHEAHRVGIIHRDIKPANILIERNPNGLIRPIVMDFGLAREFGENRGLTETGAVMGTPAYMSPEQARGNSRQLDRRADVYSLGATLYELLTGQPPFIGQEVIDVILAVINEEPPSVRTLHPNVPVDLETIALKCLAKEPTHRYDSARALAEDLQRHIDGEPIQGRRAGVLTRLRRQVRRNKALFALGSVAMLVALGLGGLGLRIQVQARRQAALSQLLGQEIKDMEWLLRSARQLPIHDLEREKRIIRERMAALQSQIADYGPLSRGLGHYALGRGHMALQEYPRALTHLQQALALGVQSAEIHYALGFVLGKHFEEAMFEARLSGDVGWVKSRLKEIEPKYLNPAIASLQRSRSLKLDAPEYMEGLIAFYQRDFDVALKQAAAALHKAPWLYEAHKLAGDVNLAWALEARDKGRHDDAETAFASAVRSYQEAAAIGPSDAQVYEGLAEAWVRQIEMNAERGKATSLAYAEAVAASDKILAAEPLSVAGLLKKAYAAQLTMAISGAGLSSGERAQRCMSASRAVLARQPDNPYASDLLAACFVNAAEDAQAHGRDPAPLLRSGLAILEPVIRRQPHFLWGLNDLASIYGILADHLALHGDPTARDMLKKSLEHYALAQNADPAFLKTYPNTLSSYLSLINFSLSQPEITTLLTGADRIFSQCIKLNSNNASCFNNYAQLYTAAAKRSQQSGQSARAHLRRAFENFALSRKLGASYLDTEQYTALAQLLDAREGVREQRSPEPALQAMEEALARCFGNAPEDAFCSILAVQKEWVAADWLMFQHRTPLPALARALAKASKATEGAAAAHPDTWQVLAETHLRLSRAVSDRIERQQHISDGLAALNKTFTINPNHANGRATQGAIFLFRAESIADSIPRRADARTAVDTLAGAIQRDPFLAHDYAPLLNSAQTLAAMAR